MRRDYRRAKRRAEGIHMNVAGQNMEEGIGGILVENNHQEIARTNYWSSEYAKKGLYFVSINAGAWRFLMPNTRHLDDIKTAREVVISRGFDLTRGREAAEFLFDDHSQHPFQLTLDLQAMDRVPSSQTDAGRWHRRFICYTTGSVIAWESSRVYYRVVDTLPCLEPASGYAGQEAANTPGSARSGDGKNVEEIRYQIGSFGNGKTIEIELWVDGKMRPFAIDPNEEFDGDRELFAAFGPQKYGFRWKVVFDGVVQYDNGHDGDAVRLLKNPKLPCFQKFRDLTFDIFKLERGKAPEPTIEGDYFVFKEEREKNE